jgi:protein NrfD
VNVCGLLLVVDLGHPERFWHMLIRSQTGLPSFKWWSPMSIGSWALALFGASSALTFALALAEENWFGLGRWERRLAVIRRGAIGRVFAVISAGPAFFVGAYTGTLLSATNQPVWADTTWLAPLFLASAGSTGMAAMILLARFQPRRISSDSLHRLEWTDTWAMVLEMFLMAAFALSLGRWAPRLLGLSSGGRWPGILIPAFVVPVGLIAPLILKRVWRASGSWLSPILVLIGGFALRAAIVGMPETLRVVSH